VSRPEITFFAMVYLGFDRQMHWVLKFKSKSGGLSGFEAFTGILYHFCIYIIQYAFSSTHTLMR